MSERAEYMRVYRATHPDKVEFARRRNSAYQLAMRRLRHHHRREFERLYREAREEYGLPPEGEPPGRRPSRKAVRA